MTPAIGSAWHDRNGGNVFVTDLCWRGEVCMVKFTTEGGLHQTRTLAEFVQSYQRGFRA